MSAPIYSLWVLETPEKMEEEIPASNPHNFEDRVEQHLPEKDLYMNGGHHEHLVT